MVLHDVTNAAWELIKTVFIVIGVANTLIAGGKNGFPVLGKLYSSPTSFRVRAALRLLNKRERSDLEGMVVKELIAAHGDRSASGIAHRDELSVRLRHPLATLLNTARYGSVMRLARQPSSEGLSKAFSASSDANARRSITIVALILDDPAAPALLQKLEQDCVLDGEILHDLTQYQRRLGTSAAAEASAEKMIATSGPRWQARGWLDLGQIRLQGGRDESAVKLFSSALDLALKTHDLEAQAQAHGNLSITYARQGSLPQAEHHAIRSVLTNAAADRRRGLAICFANCAFIWSVMGQFALSKAFADTSIVLAEKEQRGDIEANARRALAYVALRENNPDISKAHLLRALRLYGESSYVEGRASCLALSAIQAFMSGADQQTSIERCVEAAASSFISFGATSQANRLARMLIARAPDSDFLNPTKLSDAFLERH